MPAKKYFYVFIALVIIFSLLVMIFNWAVDPFWYYRDIQISGFNTTKVEFGKYERHVKPALVQREQPASLIFGSSYSEIGFNPLHPALRATGGSYNFALAGAEWDMVYCAVQFALKNDSALRQVVLGIHPSGMPNVECKAAISKMENPEERDFLFSYDALRSSVITVLKQSNGRPTHTEGGLFYGNRGRPGTAGAFSEIFHKYYHPCVISKIIKNPPILPMPQQTNLDLSGLHDIIKKANKRGIILKLVVYPRHALTFEQEYQCGIRGARWEALSQIVAMAEVEKMTNIQVWDFEGYHAIGTEKISDEPGVYWQDNAHYNTEFGTIMLDEMFGLVPPKYGEQLLTRNLRIRQKREIRERAEYIGEHPEFLEQLKNLIH
jgi:hypothetical protein